jgi:ABC-2 type transport system permease protein
VSAAAGSFALAVATLWRRELVRFARDRSRLVGSIGTPILFWLLFGFGFARSFRPPAGAGEHPLVWFFPGTVALILVFSSVFSSISLIEDRHAGFLQAVLAAPVPRAAIVLGKVLGGATTALLEASLLLALAALFRLDLPAASWAAAASAMALLAVGLTAFGFCFAWVVDSVAGFHGVMNLVMLPLWLLSGALFPTADAPAALRVAAAVDPLSYGLALVRAGLGVAEAGAPSPATAWGVVAAFAGASLLAAVALVARPRSG